MVATTIPDPSLIAATEVVPVAAASLAMHTDPFFFTVAVAVAEALDAIDIVTLSVTPFA
jgi:hypothetical protein